MTKPIRRRLLLGFIVLASLHILAQSHSIGWPNYGNDLGGSRYSTLTQVNVKNVGQLKIAWAYHTGALSPESDRNKKYAFEATPILVEGKLFLSTPFDQVIALDPKTGAEIWKYDPLLDRSHDYSEVTSRGVGAWLDKHAKSEAACKLRVYVGTLDAHLIALDGTTGKVCADFGVAGKVDLGKEVDVRSTGNYQVTSAPTVVGDVIVVGSSIADNWMVSLERGIVRGFDARSGKQLWSWDPIPWAMSTNPQTGAGNAWSTISADPERGLVFVPTGSASPDYYGGIRKGDNKWANSVVALRASTGELVWGFQVVHHDLWDYDVASQPTLFTWKNGIPAIAITTKMGRLFVLDRTTGKPLIPVEERVVPKTDMPGEEAWPTQPYSISLVPEKLNPEDAWGIKPEDLAWCRDRIKASRSEGIFTPPSLQGTIVYPGNVGGVNWGSTAYDPERHLLVMNTNRLPIWVQMIPQDKLKDAHQKMGDRLHGEFGRQKGAPFAMFREPLLAPNGLPCNPPPWGTVTAVDLYIGKKAWDTPLGSLIPGKGLGSINLGGVMATAGGLVFTGAAMDNYLRAFDSSNGQQLAEFELPASAQATPMTYSVEGKQYVVISSGGHGKLGTKQGDAVVAFTLP